MKLSHPILAITTARLREFVRRPEAVFWVYFFPVLMVVVLGVAFRNKPVEVFQVDIVTGPKSGELSAWLESDDQLQTSIVSREEAIERLRLSKTTLMITAIDGQVNNIEYQYDPVRPGSVASRNIVDQRLQTAQGRRDVIESNDVIFTEPGNSYVDFLVPGLLAMGLMGGGLWGVGYAIVDMRIRKTPQATDGDTNAKNSFPHCHDDQPAGVHDPSDHPLDCLLVLFIRCPGSWKLALYFYLSSFLAPSSSQQLDYSSLLEPIRWRRHRAS